MLEHQADQAITDGMRKLAERLDSARPSGDVYQLAGQLYDAVVRVWVDRYRYPAIYGPLPRGVIFSTQQRFGTNDPVELLAENRFDRARQVLAEVKDGNIKVDSAKELRAIASELAGPLPEGGAAAGVTHSADFTSVNWFGTIYRFDIGQQAKSVAALWEEWEKDHNLALHEKTIGEKIKSNNDRFRLAHVFRDHAAWGTMIVSAGDGCYRLESP